MSLFTVLKSEIIIPDRLVNFLLTITNYGMVFTDCHMFMSLLKLKISSILAFHIEVNVYTCLTLFWISLWVRKKHHAKYVSMF